MHRVLKNADVAPERAVSAAAGFAGRCAAEGRRDLAAKYLGAEVEKVEELAAWASFTDEERQAIYGLLQDFRSG